MSLFAEIPQGNVLPLAMLAGLSAASIVVWWRVLLRKGRSQPVIPLARRRPAPWGSAEVFLVFFLWTLLPGLAVAGLGLWAGTALSRSAEEPSGQERSVEGPAEDDLRTTHPAEQLLRHGSPATIAVAVIMAVFVAPLVEEFLFRVVLQGWMESVWSRLRRAHRRLRTGWAAWLPIALPALLFALMHLRFGKEPPKPGVLLEIFLGQMIGDVVFLLVSVAVLVGFSRATPADLGWRPEKAASDARLGLLGLLAVMPPLLIFQMALVRAAQAVHLGFAPDPIPLFALALALGWIYHRTRRILPLLVLHIAFNATSVALLLAGG